VPESLSIDTTQPPVSCHHHVLPIAMPSPNPPITTAVMCDIFRPSRLLLARRPHISPPPPPPAVINRRSLGSSRTDFFRRLRSRSWRRSADWPRRTPDSLQTSTGLGQNQICAHRLRFRCAVVVTYVWRKRRRPGRLRLPGLTHS